MLYPSTFAHCSQSRVAAQQVALDCHWLAPWGEVLEVLLHCECFGDQVNGYDDGVGDGDGDVVVQTARPRSAACLGLPAFVELERHQNFERPDLRKALAAERAFPENGHFGQHMDEILQHEYTHFSQHKKQSRMY